MVFKSVVSLTVVVAASSVALGWLAGGHSNHGANGYPTEIEHPEAGLPPDAHEKTEFAFARLRTNRFGPDLRFIVGEPTHRSRNGSSF